ncbi:hypothetical protein PFICI_13860 [Pestalotiopsis fici W106-1]|uniref:Uncharacterized protein n=1 Tax=Pestalotiopsis fici (strain W106-1 / CGMCC3.15140) TaxID=1229662 RepID=W3WJP7_PESFW|nr:uncharacterized protein PFICI_13860 [Pestalotiopsis fici W106-1]ETS73994.1 hypothetical protein PFICI_13860 [Pestalotiopsis fici W106-1]
MNSTNGTGDATETASVGWVSPPNAGRSTWGIIWSCLTIFLLCSWKCTHLNIPTVEESEAGWHHVWCIPVFPEKPLLRKWDRKLFFMGLSAIAPEMVVSLAAKQHFKARQEMQRVNNTNSKNKKYTLAHAMFAEMGGFVVHFYGETPQELGADTSIIDEAGNDDFARRMKAVAKFDKGKMFIKKAQILDLSQVAKLESIGSFNVDEADIKDRSKADPFTKVFALVQASWLVLQSCARKAAGLQITELELMTLAFTVCALFTYILWWHKPFDVERSIVVLLPESCIRVLEKEPEWKKPSWPSQWDHFQRSLSQWDHFQWSQRIVDLDWDTFEAVTTSFGLDSGEEESYHIIGTVAFYVFGAVFSSIHFAAWNWVFPLPVLQTIWQSFCAAAFGSAILPLVFGGLFSKLRTNYDGPDIVVIILVNLFFGTLVINMIARLALIVLTFYCFTSMPASAYQDLDWAQFLPHFS